MKRKPLKGQALVLVAVMLPLFLAVTGLVIDAGIVFDARRELQNTADAAARAGAMQIDEEVYRNSGGARVVIDEAGARRAAGQHLNSQELSATVSVSPERVVVRVSQDVQISFLSLVGVEEVHVGATAPAEVRHGIQERLP